MSEANTINDFYRGYLQGFKDSYHWVGLTYEERVSIIHEDENRSLLEHCERIEQALKAKNGRLEKNI